VEFTSCEENAFCRVVERGGNRTSCRKGTAFTARRRHQPVLSCTLQTGGMGAAGLSAVPPAPRYIRGGAKSEGARQPARHQGSRARTHGAPSAGMPASGRAVRGRSALAGPSSAACRSANPS